MSQMSLSIWLLTAPTCRNCFVIIIVIIVIVIIIIVAMSSSLFYHQQHHHHCDAVGYDDDNAMIMAIGIVLCHHYGPVHDNNIE